MFIFAGRSDTTPFFILAISSLKIMNTEAENKTNKYLKGIVANLPEKPGIYQYLNAEGTIIYVGKAKNLKKRVYSYFSKEHEPGKTRVLVSTSNASIAALSGIHFFSSDGNSIFPNATAVCTSS